MICERYRIFCLRYCGHIGLLDTNLKGLQSAIDDVITEAMANLENEQND